MKILKLFTCLILSISLFNVKCFALTNTNPNIKNLMTENYINVSKDKDSILSIYNNSFKEISQELKKDGYSDLKNLNNSKAYKVYKIESPNLVEGFKKNNSLQGLISNEYIWEFPIYNNKEQIITTCNIARNPMLEDLKKKGVKFSKETEEIIKKNQGKLEVYQVGNNIPLDWVSFLLDVDKINKRLEENNFINLDSIKIVSLPHFYTYILYIKDKDFEYGIPMGIREDLTKLENGKLYKISDIVSILETSFPSNKTQDKKLYGGTSYIKDQNSVLSVILLLSCVSIIIAIIYFKRKKSIIK